MRKIYLCKKFEIKKGGGGHLVEVGIFSGAYSTQLRSFKEVFI